jgi:phosphotransferase system  glucose/maltose/N-acetylglucosamine-specific IIC component
MFESVTEDPGEGALRRAARIFYVLAVLGAIGAVLLSVLALSAGAFGALTIIRLVLYLALAGLSWITGRGIDDQKPWARTVGIVLGLLELLNFPIGTVIGVVILIYLNRASKAGLFAPAPSQRVSG